MWLENLKALKKAKGVSLNQIAKGALVPESTVVRIFAGDTPDPGTSTLHRIATYLDSSLDEILAEGEFFVGRKNLKTLQEELDATTAERDALSIENADLKAQNAELLSEISLLKIQLEHKDELLAVHEYYTKSKKGVGVLK